MIGTILDGRYRVLRKLGEGAMGEVYLAEHLNLARKEALKILKPAWAADQQFVARFRREARATNRVQHPNVVSVYDFGQLPDGRFLLAMEYVEGEVLGALLRRIHRLPVSRALNILGQVADAVDHAHSCGVVHRDLKPENMILVDHHGHADVLKVLDFGIAKIVAPDYASQGLTPAGEMFGTPAYMAPERFSGHTVDFRSDLYAVGVIAFELLVGEPPFAGRLMELMHAHLTQPPDRPSQRRPDARIPPELDEVVLRLLEKDPTRRFPSGKDLKSALERVPGFGTSRASSGRHRRRAGSSDFELSDTAEGWPAVRAAPNEVDLEVAAPAPRDVRQELQAVVRDLAEVALDSGHRNVHLVMGIAELKELEQDLEQHDREMAEVERRIADLEQAARQREAALRFALGELNFERSRETGAIDGDVEKKIRTLEKRLRQIAADLEREIGLLLDRSILVAAARATTDETIQARYVSLERLIEEIAPRFRNDPIAAQRLAQLRALRKAARSSKELG